MYVVTEKKQNIYMHIYIYIYLNFLKLKSKYKFLWARISFFYREESPVGVVGGGGFIKIVGKGRIWREQAPTAEGATEQASKRTH